MENSNRILEALTDLDGHCPSGYAMAFHISFTTPKFLFQTYDRDWMDVYSKKGFVLKDPTVRWGFENNGHVLWSALQSQDAEGVLTAASEYGIKFGFTYSTDSGSSKSICSFARADREFTQEEISEISRFADQLHRDTAELKGITSDARNELKKLSVEFTHG